MTTTVFDDPKLSATARDAASATPQVVVAVDGRPTSLDALAWAADEALCRGMSLRIVTAFADPDHRHGLRTVEQAMALQRRLRRTLEPGRPWIKDAEFVVRRGDTLSLLAAAADCGDILVIGKPGDAVTISSDYQPLCPVVVVPAQRIVPADG